LHQKYPEIRGMKTLGNRLEGAERLKTEMMTYLRQLARPSKALEDFNRQYPGVSLHPEIAKLITMYEISAGEIGADEPLKGILGISPRLRLVAQNSAIFDGLPTLDANRMWHALALRMFAEHGLEQYHIFCQMNPVSCGICMTVAGQSFSIKTALSYLDKAIASGHVLPKRFLQPSQIQLLTQDELPKLLLRTGWYLPPFCHDCRCQILPSFM
jgi:hypothetical protein